MVHCPGDCRLSRLGRAGRKRKHHCTEACHGMLPLSEQGAAEAAYLQRVHDVDNRQGSGRADQARLAGSSAAGGKSSGSDESEEDRDESEEDQDESY